MVLNKWAVVTRSAPPQATLRPLPRSVVYHPKLVPTGYKTPYVIRSFIRDKHTNDIQYMENRGMYREELSIERSRFPRQHKTLVIQTDGSLNEREMEFPVPPVLLLFHDRLTAYRQRQAELAKIGQLKPRHSWERSNQDEGSETRATEDADGDEDNLVSEDGEASFSTRLCCNALEFPYCVPRQLHYRPCAVDPLLSKSSGAKQKHMEE